MPRDSAALYGAGKIIGNKSAAFSETRIQQKRQQKYSGVFGKVKWTFFRKGKSTSATKNTMDKRPRIIDVTRKPRKCPVCGGEIVDIIYGTGDMTEPEFLLEYRREGILGGDNIPRRPPIWACGCGCKRFRKVNPDGTPATVKVKLLKNVRKKPLTLIEFSTASVHEVVLDGKLDRIHHYKVSFTTEYGEKETLRIGAACEQDARDEAIVLVMEGRFGLKGVECREMGVEEI